MKYVLEDFSPGAIFSPDRMTLSYQSQILKINRKASQQLEDRLPEDVHNLMILVDDVVDTYVERMGEALGGDYRLGYAGVIAVDVFRRCYLDFEEFTDIQDEYINIFELWAAFALARTSDAIGNLIGFPITREEIGGFDSENDARFALAGDALVQATEANFMIERIQKGMDIEGESLKEKKKRLTLVKSVTTKKIRGLQVKSAKEKAFDLYAEYAKKYPEKSKSEVVEEIHQPLNEFIEENDMPISYDGIFETVMRWLRKREKWEKRKLPSLFIGRDDMKTY